MIFTVIEEKTIVQVPSASGVVRHSNFYYVIGDDSPFLFKINNEFEVMDKHRIHSSDENPKIGRIKKREKPDFEGLEMVSDGVFIVIGSGSKSPQRDGLIIINENEGFSTKRYQLTPLYSALKSMDIMEGGELNIEALAYSQNTLHLFNRGKNVVFRIKYDDLLRYLTEGGEMPVAHGSCYNLPQLGGIEAGFSGATVYEKENVMLVTASVENTDNAYDDGEVLGSFIGVLSMRSPHSTINWHHVQSKGAPLKIESIAIDKILKQQELAVTLTADNDDGRSTFVRGTLSW